MKRRRLTFFELLQSSKERQTSIASQAEPKGPVISGTENSEIPVYLQLPPSFYPIKSLDELEKYIQGVPELVELFQLTYLTGETDSTLQDGPDPHRLLRKFIKEYKEGGLPGFVKRLEELGIPVMPLLNKLVFKNENFKADIPGYAFLMTLYLAFAKIYRNTRQDAEEVEIMDNFYFVIKNKV
jgi:hypothetical protein